MLFWCYLAHNKRSYKLFYEVASFHALSGGAFIKHSLKSVGAGCKSGNKIFPGYLRSP